MSILASVASRWPFGRAATIAAAAVLVAGGGFWAVKIYRDRPAPPATIEVSKGDIEDTVIADGEIHAFRQVNVGAQVSGKVVAIKVGLGDEVKEGDLIAEIDARTQNNTLRDAQASLAVAKAKRVAQMALLKQYEIAFRRQTNLLRKDATSKGDYESAEATLDTARAQLAEIEAEIEQAEIAVDTAQVNLGYTKITAPISGTIVGTPVKEGQTVNAAQTTPTILKIAQLDTMTVAADISEADVVRIKPGDKVYFTILGDPDKRYYSTLRAIEPAPQTITESNTTSSSSSSSSSTSASSSSTSSSSQAVYYYGLFDVPNPDHRLKISMTAQVSVVLAEAKDAVLIPASILGKADSEGFRRVAVMHEDGSIAARKIKVGIDNNVTAQVLEGLEPGERVVNSRVIPKLPTDSGPRRGTRPPPIRPF